MIRINANPQFTWFSNRYHWGHPLGWLGDWTHYSHLFIFSGHFRELEQIYSNFHVFRNWLFAWLSSHRSHVKPVIHSARRVPATLRPRIKTELDRMETERTTPPSPNSQPAISENCSRSIQNIHVDAQLYSGPRQGSLYKCPQHEAYSLGPRSSNMIFNKNIYRTRHGVRCGVHYM